MRCDRPLAVDAIILYGGKMVLIRRGREPFKGMLALPGGFVKNDETVDQAVKREAKEETGLDTEVLCLVGVYSKPDRDPRGPVVSICHVLRATGGIPRAGSDAAGIELHPSAGLPRLAFDHNRMIEDAGECLSINATPL